MCRWRFKRCLFLFFTKQIEAALITAVTQPEASLLSSNRFVPFFNLRYTIHLILPAFTNDILKSVLIFLAASRRNRQKTAPPPPPSCCFPSLHWCYPARLGSARAAVIGLNTWSLWPLIQYIESLSGCDVIITAKGNVRASVNVRVCKSVCLCVFRVKSIFLFGQLSCQQQRIDARNRQLAGRF